MDKRSRRTEGLRLVGTGCRRAIRARTGTLIEKYFKTIGRALNIASPSVGIELDLWSERTSTDR